MTRVVVQTVWTVSCPSPLAVFHAQKYRDGTLYAQSLCAWTLLEEMLSEDGIRLEKRDVVLGQNGKPICLTGSVHFSLSHAKDLVAVAVSDAPVGVDIEWLDPHPPVALAFELAEFCAREAQLKCNGGRLDDIQMPLTMPVLRKDIQLGDDRYCLAVAPKSDKHVQIRLLFG